MQSLFSTVNDMASEEEDFVVLLIGKKDVLSRSSWRELTLTGSR